MGSAISSAVTSYHQLSSRSFRSFNSFNNATTLLTRQQPLPNLLPLQGAPAELVDSPTPVGSTSIPIQIAGVNPPVAPSANVQILVDPPIATTGRATAPMEVQSVNLLTGNDPPQDESRRIAEIAQPVSVAALALTLLVNAPQSKFVKPILLFLYNAYLVSLCLSLFTSVGLSMYFLVESAPSQDFPWFQKRVMIISTGSILISIMLRLFLVLSTTTMGYDGLSFVAIVAGIILYLWYSWRKANNSIDLTAARSENNTQ
ncbi:hypothetical protein LUZ61_016883 [Rhynchospora tenuis]|uniref:Uncharacterized protein n=1 Tax=Rhynchospora tenuis TaxID=198213 RepID=A0AAD5Z6H3_9POAL|nr:hypothetical protein LUZ61_016883 [Rhynchospora tenuis]